MGISKAFHWLRCETRDDRGVSLVEALAVITLTALVVGALSSFLWTGSRVYRDSEEFLEKERMLRQVAALLVEEGIRSSGIEKKGEQYIFQNNAKRLYVQYVQQDQRLIVYHGDIEMWTIQSVASFDIVQISADPLLYEVQMSGLNPSGDLTNTVANRFAPRIKGGNG